MIPKVLSIAGSDPSGGAGIQADLKTFSALGAYGMAAITSLTAQNTTGVQGVYPVAPEFLEQQLRSIFEDVPPDAVKIGMLGDAASIEVLASVLKQYAPPHIVLDPVMVATSGDRLIDIEAVQALQKNLIPLAEIITPNTYEYEILSASKEVVSSQADFNEILNRLKAEAILIKGGHGEEAAAIDVLVTKDDMVPFEAPRLATKNTHGTGCTLSSAIAVYLAQGLPLAQAIGEAKSYISGAIAHADELKVGKGRGPVHHFWRSQ